MSTDQDTGDQDTGDRDTGDAAAADTSREDAPSGAIERRAALATADAADRANESARRAEQADGAGEELSQRAGQDWPRRSRSSRGPSLRSGSSPGTAGPARRALDLAWGKALAVFATTRAAWAAGISRSSRI